MHSSPCPAGRMMRMCLRLDQGRMKLTGGMAAQAHPVALRPGHVQGARMAIQAGHARLVHFAAEKGGEFIIFIVNLAVRDKTDRYDPRSSGRNGQKTRRPA